MAIHLVTWDLIKNKNYKKLHDRIDQYDSCRIMLSVALIDSSSGSETIRDDLKQYIDNDDKLMVAKMSGNWGTTFGNACTEWLKKKSF